MAAITTSANAIVEVNKALQAVLQLYLDPESKGSIDIRFDLPEVDSTQSSPTISVFLYDVHEDLQLRQSEPARFSAASGALRAGWVNLSCNYLITYWEAQSTSSSGDGPDSSPDNQAAQVMTLTLQALLNNRELTGIAGAYTRIIPPQENLNSLGNFWQALGNRPRLSLMYSVTVPILLTNTVEQPLVKTLSSEIVQMANVDLKALNRLLWKTLCEQMGTGGEQKMARVTIDSQQQSSEEGDAFAVNLKLTVAGLADKSYQASIEKILADWVSDPTVAVTEINGAGVYILANDASGLKYL